MKSYLVLLLACLCMTSLAKEDKKEKKEEKSGDVIVLTDKNFKDMIKKHEMLMVKFYAPWCGHCKQMAPEYEKLAKELKKSGSKFKLGKLDATVHMTTGQGYKVMNYPTLKFFYQGMPIDYEGPRENTDILKFMEKKAGNPIKSVKTAKDIEKLAKESEFVVVGFFEDQKSDKAKTFIEAARLSSYVEFAMTSEKSLMQTYGIKDFGIVGQNNFPENTGISVSKKRLKFNRKFNRENIVDWAKEKSIPLLLEYNDQTSQKIMQNEDISQHLILFARFTGEDAVSQEERDKIMIEFGAAAKKHKEKFLFVYADASDPPNFQMLSYFGRNGDDTPFFMIFNLATVSKYHAPEDAKAIKKENMVKLMDQFLAGKAKQFFLSGKLKEDWDAKPLKNIVQTNFIEVTHNKKKDAMVFYFSNECENCGDKASMIEKLAEEFKDSDDKVFATINVSINEFEDESLSTDLVPLFRIFKKGTNEMIEFMGRFSVDNLRKFLLEYDIQKPPMHKPDEDGGPEDEDFEEGEDEEEGEEVPPHTEL